MKHSFVFISCLVAGSSMAVPLPIRVSYLKEERLNSRHNVLPRALLKTSAQIPKSASVQVNPKRVIPLVASTRAKPPTRSSKISVASSKNGDGNGNHNGMPSSGTPGNGSIGPTPPTKQERYPPAEATAQVDGPGHLITNNHYREDAMFNKSYRAEDHPQGKSVQGPISAYAIAGSLYGRGRATAKGYHKVTATIQNDWGTKGCIECKIPGQKPIKVDVGTGGPVKMTVENVNPALGPLEITAEQDGPGVTGATAKNHKI